MHPNPLSFDPEEEEVFLLQVPKSYDVQCLVGKKINLEKKTKLGSENASAKSFEIINKKGQEITQQLITHVASNGQHILTAVEPSGTLILREAAKEVEYGDELEEFLNKFDEAENGVILLPSDLKVRHPLLGAEYKKELASRAQTLINIRKNVKREEEAEPKKAKKRKAPKEKKPVEEDEPEPVPEKKRRKKKAMETTADLQWLENI